MSKLLQTLGHIWRERKSKKAILLNCRQVYKQLEIAWRLQLESYALKMVKFNEWLNFYFRSSHFIFLHNKLSPKFGLCLEARNLWSHVNIVNLSSRESSMFILVEATFFWIDKQQIALSSLNLARNFADLWLWIWSCGESTAPVNFIKSKLVVYK